jgi:hypothetical protein
MHLRDSKEKQGIFKWKCLNKRFEMKSKNIHMNFYVQEKQISEFTKEKIVSPKRIIIQKAFNHNFYRLHSVNNASVTNNKTFTC